MKEIESQKIAFDEKGQSLVTKFTDGSILSEPITSEEAAKWEGEHRF